MKKNNKKGFTIVELVIVIAVIAILAAVLIPTFSGVVEKANQNAAMQAARNKYELYLADHAAEVGKDMDLDIVFEKGGKTYVFKVTDGQFNAEVKDTEYTVESKADLSKVYTAVKSGEVTASNYASYYTKDGNTYKKATSYAEDTPYYEQSDIGSAEVAIYNA